MRRPITRRDGNHAALTKALEQLGCQVVDLSHAGIPGWPDAACGIAGTTVLIEFKNPETRYGRAGMNANQTVFARDWPGGPLFAVSTVDECVAVVSNIRKHRRTA